MDQSENEVNPEANADEAVNPKKGCLGEARDCFF